MHECALLQEDIVSTDVLRVCIPIIRAGYLQGNVITSWPPFHVLLVRRMSRYRESTLPLVVATPSAGMACETEPFFGGRQDVEDIAHLKVLYNSVA